MSYSVSLPLAILFSRSTGTEVWRKDCNASQPNWPNQNRRSWLERDRSSSHLTDRSASVTPPTRVRVRTNSPSGSWTRDSSAGGGRSNKERQSLERLFWGQGLSSRLLDFFRIGSACLVIHNCSYVRFHNRTSRFHWLTLLFHICSSEK